MRLEIDFSVANDPDAHQWLDRILHKIDEGWHVWDTASQADPNAFQAATWIRGRGTKGDWVRQIHVASIKRDAWTLAPHGRRVRVTARPSAADELEPENATLLAEEPLVILVENRFSDGMFVERIVKELDNALCSLWGRRGNPVRIDSVGGTGQMPEEVKRRAQEIPYRPRLVAVIDSDRKGPGDAESQDAQALRRTCNKHGLPCWVLAKREAENYLPRVLLSENPNSSAGHASIIEAWERLSNDQKNFFDMKRGLPDAPSEIEQDLFDGLPDADQEILATGFGPNVHKCWGLWHVREVRNELLTRGQGDLEYGIKLIRQEL